MTLHEADGTLAGRRGPLRTRRTIAAVLLMVCAPCCAAADAFAVAALERDARSGNVRAMLQLASRYELGEGVAKNFLKSNYLYCSAAHLGDAEGEFKLGWIYANGRAVARDHGIAAGLFTRAAAQGHEQAGRLLQYIREQLKVSINSQVPACTEPETPLALRLSRELLPEKPAAPEGGGSR